MTILRRTYLLLAAFLLAVIPMAAQQKISATPPAAKTAEGAGKESQSPAEAASWNEAITRITSWRVTPLLGDRLAAPVDTLMENYSQSVAIPSLQFGPASAITGNLGAEGMDMTWFTRPLPGRFFFNDALAPYLPTVSNTPFYNNRVPMTLLSYNTGYGKTQRQDRLRGTFNGNINRRAQAGAWFDYLYSLGSYDNQAAKHFNWGLNGSYLGDHYQVIALFNQHYSLNKENGGIQNDLYITDPAEIQGGNSKVSAKNIPVNLQNAHSRVNGREFWMNNSYRFGFRRDNPDDSTSVFVPVSRLFWTFDLREDRHVFRDANASDLAFWNDAYLNTDKTYDDSRSMTVANTVGISLLEGFNKYAKAGLTAFVAHEFTRYRQLQDYDELGIRRITKHNSLYLGGRLAKEQGDHIHYSADAKVGIAGVNAGELNLKADAELRLRLRRDTASLRVYGEFTNLNPSFFLREYVSNHFIWKNDFGMTRRLRAGGIIDIPNTGTNLSAGFENAQNLIYFGADSRPIQHSGNVQIISATLRQNLRFGIFNWENTLTYQTSTNSEVLPLPKFSVLSNAFLLFRIATLRVQFGVDCNYMTSYRALAYQPATMTFHNQNEGIRVGNYPMFDVYLNMKLSKVRFYLLVSHVNQGLFGGSNYFSAAHYPLNPRRFLFGLSIDFAN